MYDDYSDNPDLKEISELVELLAANDRLLRQDPFANVTNHAAPKPELPNLNQEPSIYTQISDQRANLKADLSKLDHKCFKIQKALELLPRGNGVIPTEQIMRSMEDKMKMFFAEAQVLDEQLLMVAHQHMQEEAEEYLDEEQGGESYV